MLAFANGKIGAPELRVCGRWNVDKLDFLAADVGQFIVELAALRRSELLLLCTGSLYNRHSKDAHVFSVTFDHCNNSFYANDIEDGPVVIN